MAGLVKSYATIGKPDAQGFIERGSYSVRGGAAPDDYVIWGDYYYLEAWFDWKKESKATGMNNRTAVGNDRAYWLATMLRIADPVIKALAARKLRATMPVENKKEEQLQYTHLEAFARTLVGMAPWLRKTSAGCRRREASRSLR